MIERVLVADDEPLARERVRQLVSRVAPGATIWDAGDGDDAIALIRAHAPQVVFLDIEMPGRRGFEVVNVIGPERMPATVFVTAYDEHALAAFDAAALDYLLKPVDEARFRTAWRKVEDRIGSREILGEAERLRGLLASAAKNSPTLVLKDAGRSVVVRLDAVRWIESSGNHVLFHAAEGPTRIRGTLASIEARLDPTRFARIHRRYLVALDALREVRAWSGGDQLVVLDGGAKLPVSRNHRDELEARLRERR
ncbi:MAG TPA: LytTR family DNA-binding domain-containing protein [Candidatus Polarisedimenticolaceae bacterium]|nr:LytTR family DNA-binding domain-containing protein [Candidatus Polarisedimenticolaceae bacterium]